MTDLERLTKLVGETQHNAKAGETQHNAKAEEIARHLLANGMTLPPAPKREWVVTEEAYEAWRTVLVRPDVNSWKCLAAVAPFLVRAWIEGLTEEELERVGGYGSDAGRVRVQLLSLTRDPA